MLGNSQGQGFQQEIGDADFRQAALLHGGRERSFQAEQLAGIHFAREIKMGRRLEALRHALGGNGAHARDRLGGNGRSRLSRRHRRQNIALDNPSAWTSPFEAAEIDLIGFRKFASAR